MNKITPLSPLALALMTAWLSPSASLAQVAPNAGSSLETLRRQPQALPQGPTLSVPEREIARRLGGKAVQIRQISLEGHRNLSAESVLAAIGAPSLIQKPLDIDGIRALADQVGTHFQRNGFPFARAFLPVQDLQDGKLVIQIVEGRFGKVIAKSPDTELAEASQGFLQGLVAGQVIASAPLERATLLINDLPGVAVVPVMKPGAQAGEGDLDVLVEQVQTRAASLSVDNHGSRYTGPYRLQFNGAINRAFVVGDQLSITGIAPVQGLWVGSVNYAIPLGSDGLRVQAGLSRLNYKLREDFEGFKGEAEVRSLTLSYPFIRSRSWNLGTSLSYQNKDLKDVSTYESTHKTAEVFPLTVSFDQRDALLGAGLSYGALTASTGGVKSGANSKDFTKWTFDLARIQQLGDGWSLYGRWFEQGTSDNLDSSEKAQLGGATGVRAYPSGEASGDKARLFQAELRLSMGAWSPYAFYDQGKVKVDARPEQVNLPTADKKRAGAGLGIRYLDGSISWSAALAWRTNSISPEADTKTAGAPRVWLEARYAF